MSEDKVKSDVASIFKKAMITNGRWDKDSFPEYGDVVYWLRQSIGLFAGIICGALALVDIFGFSFFVVAIISLPYFYYTNYSKINIDDFGAIAMLSEGLMPSFGVFLLTWIIVYSGMNF